jgi:hypothetical protein
MIRKKKRNWRYKRKRKNRRNRRYRRNRVNKGIRNLLCYFALLWLLVGEVLFVIPC